MQNFLILALVVFDITMKTLNFIFGRQLKLKHYFLIQFISLIFVSCLQNFIILAWAVFEIAMFWKTIWIETLFLTFILSLSLYHIFLYANIHHPIFSSFWDSYEEDLKFVFWKKILIGTIFICFNLLVSIKLGCISLP